MKNQTKIEDIGLIETRVNNDLYGVLLANTVRMEIAIAWQRAKVKHNKRQKEEENKDKWNEYMTFLNMDPKYTKR